MLKFIFLTSLAFAETPAPEVAEPAEVVVPAGEEVKAETEEVKEEPKTEPVKEEPKAETKEEVPADYNEAAETVSLLVKAIQDKNWALAIGLLLTLLVFVANKFGLKDKVGSKAVPWVATGLATVASLGVALANGLAVTDAISQGILAGLTAIGGWEMLFKHILSTSKSEEG
tara:strand:+ start:502 stop:1017 length:516 start_codon:yes stop_codon:yes gene_type:complete